MSVDKYSSPGNLRASQVFYAGFGLYLLSFLLPVVTQAGMPMRGWTCALVSLWLWAAPEHSSVLVIFGGIINPLVIACVVLRFYKRADALRFYLSTAILFCIPFTWLFFAHC